MKQDRIQKTAIGTALMLFFGLCYGYSGNQNFIFDALTNAIACEAGEPIRWFHPNHLLYPFLGMLWYRFERLLGYTGYAVYSLERFNSLLTVAGLGLFYLAVCRFVAPKKAWIVSFFLGSTYLVWHFAVDGYTVGAIPFFSCLLLWALSRTVDKELNRKDAACLAALSFLYIGVHSLGALHFLAVAWWLGVAKRSETDRGAAGMVSNLGVRYLAVLGTLLMSSYIAVYLTVVRPASNIGFLQWGIGYAGYYGLDKALDWPLVNLSLIGAVKGYGRAWFESFLWAYRTTPRMWVLIIATGTTVAGLLVCAFLRRKTLDKERGRFFTALYLWGILNSIVACCWAPGYVGFRIHFVFAFFLGAAVALAASPVFFRTLLLAGALMFTFNFSGPIYFDSSISNNEGYRLLLELNERMKPNDFFVCADGDVPEIQGLRQYFFPQLKGGSIESRLFEFRETSLTQMRESLERHLSGGSRVYFSGNLQNPDVQSRIEEKFGLAHGDIAGMLARFNLDYAFNLSNGIPIFEAKLKNSQGKQI